jgi:fucose permease
MKPFTARGTLAATSASFFALGMVTASLGPALPDLATHAATSLAAIGTVFTALFCGGLVAQLVAGPLNDRIGQRPVLLAGLVLLFAGTIGLTISPSLALMLACAFIAGLGHGAIDVSTNVLIAEVFANRSASALNLLNVFFGLGAFAGPAIAGLTLRVWGTALPGLWLGAGLMLMQTLLVPLLAVPSRDARLEAHAAPSGWAVLRGPTLWSLGALLLLYVGVENGIGGWTTTYLERTTALGAATSALITASFWLALTAGRVVGALAGTRMAAGALLLASLAGSLVSGVLLAASVGNALLSALAVLAIGLFFGPIFPTTLAIVTSTFRRAPGTAASVAVALGSAGGMLIPPLQGVLLERSGPAASVLLVAIGTLLMLAIGAGRELLGKNRLARTEPAAGNLRHG